MKSYKLLSGEIIDLLLQPEEIQDHISTIERLITNSEDYHEVYRHAFVPLQEGKSFTTKTLKEMRDSPHYKIIFDLVERYYHQLYS